MTSQRQSRNKKRKETAEQRRKQNGAGRSFNRPIPSRYLAHSLHAAGAVEEDRADERLEHVGGVLRGRPSTVGAVVLPGGRTATTSNTGTGESANNHAGEGGEHTRTQKTRTRKKKKNERWKPMEGGRRAGRSAAIFRNQTQAVVSTRQRKNATTYIMAMAATTTKSV